MRLAHFCLSLIMAAALVSCASVTVTKITPQNAKTVAGIHYFLPKPCIQVVPQADDTIAVDVVYLPDSNNEYAIDTSSTMSSYTFQSGLDQNGLLNAVEFKQNTSPVGQQLAASAGAATAQIYNVKNAQLVAAQTAINTAQNNVDSARSALDAAQSQLAADTANGVAANLNSDQATVATSQAKLQDAQQVLDRVRNTAQAVSVTATAGTPITTSPPTPGTTGFGPQTWTPLPVYELPERRGAILYMINEGTDAGGKPKVSLNAAKFDVNPDGTGGNTQKVFNTTSLALGPPVLKPQNNNFPLDGKQAIFILSQDILKIISSGVTDGNGKSVTDAAKVTLKDSKTVILPLDKLNKGQYVLEIGFAYEKEDHFGTAKVNFSVY